MNLSLLTSLSPKGKGILAACAVGFIAAAIMLVKMAGSTSYTQIMAGVDPAQTGKITAALSQAGVAYELQNNGTAVAVDSSQTGPANIALASAGLTGMSKQPGFELLDKQKLGASNFQQQVAYQRALEGQIANTIGQIAGVGSAQVSLTLPKDQLFTDEAQSATAAVLLGGSGDAIDPGAVRGIANLVSSSVQGLKTSNVTITDAGGQMLWPLADAAGAGATSKPAAEARYNAQLQASLNAMLVSTLGPGKARVQVNSDLNVDKASQEKLQYAKVGVPLTATNDTETLAGTGAASGGAAGTATNIPSYAQAAGGGTGKSNYKHVTKTTTFGVDKTITHTQIAPGAVNRLNVALVLDKAAAAKLGPAGVKSLQAAVASAAGIVPSRGDSLAVSQVAFAPVTTPAAPKSALPIPASMLAYAKTALLGLAALLFLFFVSRGLRRRQSGAFTEEPAWLRQLSLPAPPMLSAGDFEEEDRLELDRFDAQEAAKKIFANDPRAIALEEIVEKEPDKIAQHLRTWITEDN